MASQEIKSMVYAVLGTMAESDNGCPESLLYLGLGADIEIWSTVRAVLVNRGLITVSSACWVELTDSGRKLGAAINLASQQVATG